MKGPVVKRSEIEETLTISEFFKDMEKSDIEKIGDLSRVETYDVGDCIFQQGDFGEQLYIIARGRVFLERDADLGARKGSVIIEALGKGRVLGCWSTLLGESHILMSSASCQQPTKVVAFKGSDLRKLMRENKAFGFNMLERLCFLLRDRIQAAYGAMENI
ncbi:MAG: cyclic nucleotide-binding domain-containing protein [Desulfobacterales bacterium]|nr:cyclic nucleotide-binding domain-containing protein [Desulfobacterales bacterium]